MARLLSGNNSVFGSWACRAAENRKYIGLPFYQHAAPMELGESRSEEKNHTTWIDWGEEFRLI